MEQLVKCQYAFVGERSELERLLEILIAAEDKGKQKRMAAHEEELDWLIDHGMDEEDYYQPVEGVDHPAYEDGHDTVEHLMEHFSSFLDEWGWTVYVSCFFDALGLDLSARGVGEKMCWWCTSENELELQTAADGRTYLKWLFWFQSQEMNALTNVLVNQFPELKVYWNVAGETNDHEHVFFSQEEVSQTVVKTDEKTSKRDVFFSQEEANQSVVKVDEKKPEEDASEGPGWTYLDTRDEKKLPNVLVDFDAFADLRSARKKLGLDNLTKGNHLRETLAVAQPREGAKEVVNRLLRVCNVYFYVSGPIYRNTPCCVLEDWLDEVFGVNWGIGGRIIFRPTGYWEDQPLQACCLVAHDFFGMPPHSYNILTRGVRGKAHDVDSWEDVADYIVGQVLK